MPYRSLPIAALLMGAVPALAVDIGNSADTLMIQARSQIAAGQYAAALTTLSQALQIAPGDADALNLMGFASRKTGALDQAERYYAEALALAPDHFGALEYQGELFLMTGRIDMAKANLARLARDCAPCEEHDDLAGAIAAAGH